MATYYKNWSSIAGASILLMALIAGFSYGYVWNGIVDSTSHQTTFNNVRSSISIFRYGIFGWVLIFVLDLVVSWALFEALKRVNFGLSIWAAGARLIYSLFLAAAIYQLISILPVISLEGEVMSRATEVGGRTENFMIIWTYGLIVFGVHLFLLGYLLLKSDIIPNLIGLLLIVAGASYMFLSGGQALFPHYNFNTLEMLLGAPMAIGELVFAIWLLTTGRKVLSV